MSAVCTQGDTNCDVCDVGASPEWQVNEENIAHDKWEEASEKTEGKLGIASARYVKSSKEGYNGD